MKHPFLRLAALLLALLCAAGCAAAPAPVATPTPEPTPTLAPLPALSFALPEAAPAATAFADMAYARPDVDEIERWMAGVSLRVPQTEDFRTLLGWADTARRLYGHVSTMRKLAGLHSSMDKSDAHWLAEHEWISHESVGLYYAYEELRLAMQAHPEYEALAAVLPRDFFHGLEPGTLALSTLLPLYEQEQALVNRYAAEIATWVVLDGGRAYSLPEINALADYDTYTRLYAAWCAAHQAHFAQLYIELVKVRRQIAAACGYDSYAAYVLDMEERDYTVDMMRAHVDALAQTVAPAYREMADRYGAMYYPEVEMELEPFFDFLAQTLEDLDERLLEPLLAMRAYALCDLEARPYKEAGAYTTYLEDYALPFLFLTYTGDLWSMTTLVHEYGHFLDYYRMPEEAALATLDTSEVFSQALELLVANHYPEAFGRRKGYMLRYDTVSSSFHALVTQPYYTAVELEVYALPEEALTVEGVNRIAQEQAERFGLASEDYPLLYAQGWVDIPHLYEYPYYTFTYATAVDVALQIWELSLTDEQAAVAAYFSLLERETSVAFLENVEAAGLTSPFSPGRAAALADFCTQYLEDEDWDAAA